MNDLNQLYQDLIVDHFKNPRNQGAIDCPDGECRLFNPLCGDEVTVSIKYDGDRIASLKFFGKGCSISQASASMMSEICQGLTLGEARSRIDLFGRMMKESIPQNDLVTLGDAASLQGVKQFAARIKCAILAWEALGRAMSHAELPNGAPEGSHAELPNGAPERNQ